MCMSFFFLLCLSAFVLPLVCHFSLCLVMPSFHYICCFSLPSPQALPRTPPSLHGTYWSLCGSLGVPNGSLVGHEWIDLHVTIGSFRGHFVVGLCHCFSLCLVMPSFHYCCCFLELHLLSLALIGHFVGHSVVPYGSLEGHKRIDLHVTIGSLCGRFTFFNF